MFVYLVTNKINGKKYVGQHSGDSLKRYWRHCTNHALSGSIDKPYLYNAIRKYGIQNFIIEPIVLVETKQEMDSHEKRLIADLNTRKPNGYNLTDGGDGVLGFKHSEESNEKNRQAHLGKKMSEQSSEKKRLAMIGFKHTNETKQRMSEYVKTEDHCNKISTAKMGNKSRTGMPHSEESKRRISDSHKGVPLSESHKAALRKARHIQWHVARGIINPNCKFCQGTQCQPITESQLAPNLAQMSPTRGSTVTT